VIVCIETEAYPHRCVRAYVEVSCGGCHTLVIARPRQQSDMRSPGGDDLLESAEEPTCTEKLSAVSEMIKREELSNSLDMSGSIAARIRRRQKMPVITRYLCQRYYSGLYCQRCLLQLMISFPAVEHTAQVILSVGIMRFER